MGTIYKIYIPNNIIVRHDLRTGRITTHGLTFSGNTARIEREQAFNTENVATEESVDGNGAVDTDIGGGIQGGIAATVAAIHMAGRSEI